MENKLLNISYDIDAGVPNIGATTESNIDASSDIDLSDSQLDTGLENIGELSENQENNIDINEFDYENIDFENNPDFDPAPYQVLTELGIKIDTPQFQKALSELSEYGISGIENQIKYLTKARQKVIQDEIKYKPENVHKTMMENLNTEERANYKTVIQSMKNALSQKYSTVGDKQRQEFINRVVKYVGAEPTAIKLLNIMHGYYNKGQSTMPRAVEISKTNSPVGTLSYDEAVKQYNTEMTKAIEEGRPRDQSKIIKEVLKKVKKQDFEKFKENYDF